MFCSSYSITTIVILKFPGFLKPTLKVPPPITFLMVRPLLLTQGFISWLINLQLFANIYVDQVQVTARGVCRLVLRQHYDMIILLA